MQQFYSLLKFNTFLKKVRVILYKAETLVTLIDMSA